ncbi:MAG: DUF115 domain-containing protein [Roseburia sp.]|nr:DUF115 domain-containing protein [Roseburia sp.]
MKYVIWGAGFRGRVLTETVGIDNIVAFIDSDKEKIGTIFCGKHVISYEQYKKEYTEYVILISVALNEQVSNKLTAENMFHLNIEDCPPEFAGYGWRRAQRQMKDLRLNLPDKLAIYGSTFYSVIVYENLRMAGYHDLSLIPDKSMSPDMLEKFAVFFPYIKLDALETTPAESLLITVYDRTIAKERTDIPHIDIFDWTQYVSEYRNNRIASMKDKYKGQRCFIVATGPSLTIDDLETLHDNHEFCISMNSIFKCFGETKWRPNQYVIVDVEAINIWINEIQELDVAQKFIPDAHMFFDYDSLRDDCYVYHSIFGQESLGDSAFSEDFSAKAYNSGTVTNVCIQLAAYLGFSQIYLLGVDFTHHKGKVEHFRKDHSEEKTIYNQEESTEIIYKYYAKGYQTARTYADNHGFKIYNATRGGELEIFERINFDSLFSKEGRK